MKIVDLRGRGYNEAMKKSQTSFTKLPAGAYVCMIVDADAVDMKEKGVKLVCDIDIAEGEFAGYFQKRLPFTGKWDFNAQFERYIYKGDGKIAVAFTAFVNSLEKQNPGFRINPDELNTDKLIGLYCGFSFFEREYLSGGEIRSTTTLKYYCDVEKVRAGEVKTPAPERIKTENDDTFYDLKGTSVKDSDVPF